MGCRIPACNGRRTSASPATETRAGDPPGITPNIVPERTPDSRAPVSRGRENGQTASAMSPARLVRLTRLLTFVVVAVFLIGAPFYVQVLGRETKWLRGWRMYSGHAADWCFVHYHRYERDGTKVPLRRLAALGIEPGSSAWREEREIRTPERARIEGKRLCRALGVGIRLGFSMKCGVGERAWNVLERDSGDVCRD